METLSGAYHVIMGYNIDPAGEKAPVSITNEFPKLMYSRYRGVI